MTEHQLVPGNPVNWQEFEVDDYDPKAAPGSDEDTLGELLAMRTPEDPFGIVILVDLIEDVPDDLSKRLANARVPTKIRREAADEAKKEAKKTKKKAKSS